MRRKTRSWRAAATVGLLVLASGPAGRAAEAPASSQERVQPRVFEVRYRPLADAADLVEGVLSPAGTMTLKPRLKILIVEDQAGVLERVESLLASFDIPPRSVEVTLALFLGTKRVEDERSKPRRSVIDLPSLQFTKWTAYESLGSRSVNGVEGDQVMTNLSDNYRVVFMVEAVDERNRVVKFKSVSLQRLEPTPDGSQKIETLYTVGTVVESGKQQIFGAANDPEADRALFLTVKAEMR